jgi:hypothetical protein
MHIKDFFRKIISLESTDDEWGCRDMKLYRVNKLAKAGGMIVKKNHILAASDQEAVRRAEESPDCPVCDVTRDGQKVGHIH